jgi:uncharacterized delta-60 repeat protein
MGNRLWMRTVSLAALLAGVVLLAGGSAQATPGALDTTFGSGGEVTGPYGHAYAVALAPDGKIAVAGYEEDSVKPGSSPNDFVVAEYYPDGSPAGGFGQFNFGLDDDEARAVAVQPDGKVVAAGWSYQTMGAWNFAVVRFTSYGTYDSTFGNPNQLGRATADLGSPYDFAYALALQPDGKILLGGHSRGVSDDDFALFRFKSDGTPDPKFGANGKAPLQQITSGDDGVNALALQPDGQIIAAGYGNPGTGKIFAVARYNTNGSLDNSFGTAGSSVQSIGGQEDAANAVAVQPDGKIVLAGYSFDGSKNHFALLRYTADGKQLDTTFGMGGKVVTPSTTNDRATGLALQPDGKIVVAGSSDDGAKNSFEIARYNPSGSLDTSFGSGGIIRAPLDASGAAAYGMALQPDGKIVAAGEDFASGSHHFTIARFLGNTLSVTKSGSGTGTVASSPAGIDCGSTCSSPFAAIPITLTATPATGSVFSGWSGGGCSGTGTCRVQLSSDEQVTATFTRPRTLNVTTSGPGSVRSSPPGIDCGATCSHVFADGTSVTLTATPAPGYAFSGWGGNCSGTGTCSLQMTADRAVTATFSAKPPPTRCVVPSVKRKRLAAAKRAIRRAHCSVGRITRAYSAKVKRGRVISQKPKPGTTLPHGAKVSLKVSKGRRL